MSVSLPDFLLARIAEDEERAGLAAQLGAQWQPGGSGVWIEATTVLASDGKLPRSGRSVAEVDDVAVPHVLSWSPARVLAECDAKRRIVAMRKTYDGRPITGESPGAVSAIAVGAAVLDAALTALALPYADHADYDETWRP